MNEKDKLKIFHTEQFSTQVHTVVNGMQVSLENGFIDRHTAMEYSANKIVQESELTESNINQ
jgi:hypothetical protein